MEETTATDTAANSATNSTDNSASNKKKIAILGSGPGGLAAAWALTDTEELRATNEVTVYQVGWRSGGKCATGRYAPAEHMEQNCAHYLFGCYDNTIQMARDAYGELREAGASWLPKIDDVLLPRNLIAMKQRFKGKWETWILEFPSNSAEPGAKGGEFLSDYQYTELTLEWLLEAAFGWKFAKKVNKIFYEDRKINNILTEPLSIVHGIVHVLAALTFWITKFFVKFLFHKHPFLDKLFAWMLRGVRAVIWFFDKDKVEHSLGRLRRWTLIDYALTTVIGSLNDQVFQPGGFESIDHLDFKDWLKQNGATKYGYESPFVDMWYQNSLAFPGGDVSKTSLSAGVSLLAQMRAMFTYKGAVAFSLDNEVGDSYIAPVYLALKARGVKFNFFHKVEEVTTNPENNEVTGIRIDQQVSMGTNDPADYNPLTEVKGRWVWPGQPDTSQWSEQDQDKWARIKGENPEWNLDLESFYSQWQGEQITLQRGVDFDDVVYAMPHSTIKYSLPSLYENVPKWKSLFDENPVSESQMIRLWFKPTLSELGWDNGPPILSGYEMPYCTWEDDTQLAKLQNWPAGELPGSIACVFGPLSAPIFPPGPEDTTYLPGQRAKVALQSGEFTTRYATGLWPKAGSANNPAGIDPDKLLLQRTRANAGPLEGYLTTWPGSLKTRLKADESEVDGLFLAGDWVRNGLEAGSMEGATMAGFQASRAICGYPKVVIGERDSYS